VSPSPSACVSLNICVSLSLCMSLSVCVCFSLSHCVRLEGKSARNIKLVEDILTPLGISTPYTTDGGNLTLEFTIQAADVRGAVQVFSDSFAFGTYPLQVLP